MRAPAAASSCRGEAHRLAIGRRSRMISFGSPRPIALAIQSAGGASCSSAQAGVHGASRSCPRRSTSLRSSGSRTSRGSCSIDASADGGRFRLSDAVTRYDALDRLPGNDEQRPNGGDHVVNPRTGGQMGERGLHCVLPVSRVEQKDAWLRVSGLGRRVAERGRVDDAYSQCIGVGTMRRTTRSTMEDLDGRPEVRRLARILGSTLLALHGSSLSRRRRATESDARARPGPGRSGVHRLRLSARSRRILSSEARAASEAMCNAMGEGQSRPKTPEHSGWGSSAISPCSGGSSWPPGSGCSCL